MCASFSNGDVGKSVVNDNGEAVGVVASVDGDVAHVRPETVAVDSVKSSIGWEGVADATRPLDAGSVREITDDAVRLEGDLEAAVDANTGGDASDGPEASRDRPSDRGLEADPTELARQEREGGAQPGPSVEPTDEFEPAGAAVDPDAETEPTDAAVDPDEDADGDTDQRED